MGKASLSVTVDKEVLALLDEKGNRSENINQILKRALKREEGILTEIEYHQNCIETLRKELVQLKERKESKIVNISDRLKDKLKIVKEILGRHPDKVNIWTDIINRDYEMNISKQDLYKLMEKWG